LDENVFETTRGNFTDENGQLISEFFDTFTIESENRIIYENTQQSVDSGCNFIVTNIYAR